MRHNYLPIVFILFFSLAAQAQAVLLKSFPNINLSVHVETHGYHFLNSDSVKIKITLTNNTGTAQEILFDEPYTKDAPWWTSTSVKNSSGKSMVLFEKRDTIFNSIYRRGN